MELLVLGKGAIKLVIGTSSSSPLRHFTASYFRSLAHISLLFPSILHRLRPWAIVCCACHVQRAHWMYGPQWTGKGCVTDSHRLVASFLLYACDEARRSISGTFSSSGSGHFLNYWLDHNKSHRVQWLQSGSGQLRPEQIYIRFFWDFE